MPWPCFKASKTACMLSTPRLSFSPTPGSSSHRYRMRCSPASGAELVIPVVTELVAETVAVVATGQALLSRNDACGQAEQAGQQVSREVITGFGNKDFMIADVRACRQNARAHKHTHSQTLTLTHTDTIPTHTHTLMTPTRTNAGGRVYMCTWIHSEIAACNA